MKVGIRYSFANNPFRAANAPLAMARMIQWVAMDGGFLSMLLLRVWLGLLVDDEDMLGDVLQGVLLLRCWIMEVGGDDVGCCARAVR